MSGGQGPPVGHAMRAVRPTFDSDSEVDSLHAPTLNLGGLDLDFTDLTKDESDTLEDPSASSFNPASASSPAAQILPQHETSDDLVTPAARVLNEVLDTMDVLDQHQQGTPTPPQALPPGQDRSRSRSRSPPPSSPAFCVPHIFDTPENKQKYRSIAFEHHKFPANPNLQSSDAMDAIFKAWPKEDWTAALMRLGVEDVDDTTSPLECVQNLFDTAATPRWVESVTAHMYQAFPYYKEAKWTLPNILLWEVICNFSVRLRKSLGTEL
eukprot:7862661-Pyramimonas_sp.AAC.1